MFQFTKLLRVSVLTGPFSGSAAAQTIARPWYHLQYMELW